VHYHAGNMGRTYYKLYVQAVFVVKYRRALIGKDWSQTLFRNIGNLINEAGGHSLIVNGVSDHVHCLFSLPPSLAISDVMKVAKAKSSRWINENRLTPVRFEWQKGFAAFSYHVEQLERVRAYIASQEVHHGTRSFPDEVRALHREHRVEPGETDPHDPLE
jgi:putative transposase